MSLIRNMGGGGGENFIIIIIINGRDLYFPLIFIFKKEVILSLKGKKKLAIWLKVRNVDKGSAKFNFAVISLKSVTFYCGGDNK